MVQALDALPPVAKGDMQAVEGKAGGQPCGMQGMHL